MTRLPQAEELAEQGRKSYQAGQYASAARQFEQAALLYHQADQPVQAAEMKNNCSVAHLKHGDHAEALDAVLGSAAVFQQAGLLCQQAMALANQAAALEGLQRFEEAITLYQQADQILSACGEHELRAIVLHALAAVQLRSGQQIQALAAAQTALSLQHNLTLRQRVLARLFGTANRLLGR